MASLPEVKTVVLRIHTLNVSFRQNSKKVVRVVNIWKQLANIE